MIYIRSLLVQKREMKSSFEAQITELNEQKTLLESIIDHAPAGIYIKDIEGRYVLCNRTFCDWHDIPFERLEGKTVWDIFGEEKARLFSSKDIECRETKKAIEHESEITYADGMVKSEYTVRFPVLDDRGEILGTGGIDIDISQRKNAEVEVENQKKLLETLIENMDLGVHLFDSNLKIVIANQTSARLMGLPKDFLSPGTSLESIVRYQYEHGELYDTRDSVDEEVDYWLNFRRNAKESYKYERKRPNGSYLDIRNVKLPNGGWIGTETEITELKQAELALKRHKKQLVELNQRLELANIIVSMGVWDWDLKTNEITWDNQMYEIFGLPRGEPMTYEKWKAGVHPEDLPVVKSAISNMLNGVIEGGKEIRIVRPDGEVRHVDSNGIVLYDESNQATRFVGVNWDITERKLAQIDLDRSNNQFRALADNLPEFITLKDLQGRFLFINKRFEEWTHMTYEDVVGKNVHEIYSEQQAAEFEKLDRQVIESGEILSREADLWYPDGNTRTVISTRFPVTSATGKVLGIGTINHDITERKRMEQMKAEFISTVSHELRTPLTSIRGSLGLVKEDVVGELPPEAKDMIVIAYNNTERLLLLINDILDIQKIESDSIRLDFQNLNIVPFLKQALAEHAGYGEEQGVRFSMKQRAEDGWVYADKDRLMQVMGNLLSNAAKFSPEGSTVEVSLARPEKGRVRVSVSDSGSGIAKDFRDNIFQRFSQSDSSDTRQKGGTGLGLAISRGIIERHDGYLDYISHEGIGSIFYFELPEFLSTESAQSNEPKRSQLSDGAPCILIVEDDADVAALLQRMLAESGYDSDIAYSAEQARQLLAERGAVYKLMTLDIILPKEDGVSLLASLRREAETQNLPVIVVSASANETKKELNGGAVSVVDWLQKPIDQNRLIAAVASVSKSDSGLPRVLHVEDESDIHHIVKFTLKGLCELEWAVTLEAAREMMKKKTFDLIILDIGLPDGSGLELLELLESQVTPPEVVIFSALDVSAEDARRVNAVLAKHRSSNDELMKVIKESLKN